MLNINFWERPGRQKTPSKILRLLCGRLAGTKEISPTSEHIRHVNGELHLKVDLKPSSPVSHFRVEVRDFLSAYIKLITDTD